LEWCTDAENIQHSYATNLARKSNAHKLSMPVKGRRGDGPWVSYKSVRDAARLLGLLPGSISNSCWKGCKAKGYSFEFDEANEVPLLEGEEWKPWGAGKISNLGRYEDCRGVIKTPTPGEDGYARFRIGKKNKSMHRIVAELFLPPPLPGQTQVDHITGKGNQWYNLRWASPSENIQHSYEDPNRKSSGPALSKKVRITEICTTEVQIFASVTEAGHFLGVDPSIVSKLCKNADVQTRNL
jgi:hypothetical protein